MRLMARSTWTPGGRAGSLRHLQRDEQRAELRRQQLRQPVQRILCDEAAPMSRAILVSGPAVSGDASSACLSGLLARPWNPAI